MDGRASEAGIIFLYKTIKGEMTVFQTRTPNYRQMELFGCMIRNARKHLGFTQEELAEAVGCSPHWINKIECGKSNPNWADAFRFAVILGLEPIKILEEAGIDVPVLTN